MLARKRYRPEEIIAKLREAEVSQGLKVSEVIKQLGIHEVTYYCWRKEYGGMRVAPRWGSSRNWRTRTRGSAEPSLISRWTR